MKDPSALLCSITSSRLFGEVTEEKAKIICSSIEKVSLAKGATLFAQGKPSDAMFLVLSGRLQVYRSDGAGADVLKGEVGPGEPIGEIQFLTGGMHTATIRADSDSELIRIPRVTIDRLTEIDSGVTKALAEYIHGRLRKYRLYDTLPKLFGTLDENTISDIEGSVEWKRLDGGDTLFRQGDIGDSLYVVISGRLQAVVENPDGSRRVVGEVMRGESAGEMGLFTEENRSATVFALRDTELIRFSKPAFERIMTRYPQVVKHIAQILIQRLRKNITSTEAFQSFTHLTLVGADKSIDLAGFSESLVRALTEHTQVIALDSRKVDRLLETPGISQTPSAGPQNIRLETWLDDLETKYSLVIFETDSEASNWSRRCLRQADRILIVADATRNPASQGMEAELLSPECTFARCCRQLVLLREDKKRLPSDTIRWLTARRIEKHFHVHPQERDDFRRLARLMTGRGVGLVLGGGDSASKS